MHTLVYRSGAIGDIIHCLPALKLYKDRNPDGQLSFLIGSKDVQNLLEIANVLDYVDHIFVFDPKKTPEATLIDFLRDHPVDDFIFLHSNFIKPWIINLQHIKAKRVTIYKKNISLSAHMNFAITLVPDLLKEHKIDYLSKNEHKVLDSVVLDPVSVLSAIPTQIREPYICIVPGVGRLRPARAYPVDFWLDFIRMVLKLNSYKIVLLGGPDESDLSVKINYELDTLLKNSSVSKLINLIGKTSLSQSAMYMAASSQVFSADTGLLHIAAALDVDCIAVYSITSEFRTGPFSKKATVLRSETCKCIDLDDFSDNKLKICKLPKADGNSCISSIFPNDLLRKLKAY